MGVQIYPNVHLYDPDGPDSLPLHLNYYGASDYATMDPKKGKKEPDFTEHGVFGVCQRGDLWAVDWWSMQTTTDKSINAFIALVKRWKPLRWWNEGGVIDKAIGPSIRDSMIRARTFVTIEELPLLMDKGVKLQAFHARYSARTVHFPIKRPWAERVIDQLVKFPGGRFDDAADVCGLIGRGVDQMVDARIPDVIKRPQLVPFTEQWLEWKGENQKPRVRYF